MSKPPDTQASGTVLLQGFLQYFCLGVVLSQALKFWKRSAEDTVYLRSFVVVLLVGGCLQTALSTYKVWVVTVTNRHWWGNSLSNTDFLVNGLISTVCESFLINRCWKVTGRKTWVLITLLPLALIIFSANIYMAVRAAQSVGREPLYTDPLRDSGWAFPCFIYVSLVLDLGVTMILSAFLWKSRTGCGDVDKTLRTIVGICWESATLPCLFMVISASLFFSAKTTPEARHLDLFFILSTSKFYTLGLLRSLNSRKKFRKHMKAKTVGRQSLGSWLSNEDTVVDQEEHHGIAGALELGANDNASPCRQPAEGPPASKPASPDLDSRERGITIKRVEFVLVN